MVQARHARHPMAAIHQKASARLEANALSAPAKNTTPSSTVSPPAPLRSANRPARDSRYRRRPSRHRHRPHQPASRTRLLNFTLIFLSLSLNPAPRSPRPRPAYVPHQLPLRRQAKQIQLPRDTRHRPQPNQPHAATLNSRPPPLSPARLSASRFLHFTHDR